MSGMPKHPLVRLVANVLFVAMSLSVVLNCQRARAQTFSVEQIERRIVMGFQVDAERLQARLPSPWQLDPLAGGALKGANLFITLVDNLRTENSQGKASIGGTLRFVFFAAPATNPQTGQTVAVVLGGFASNAAYVPGFYKVYSAATIKIQHTTRSLEGGAEEQADVWEVLDGTGKLVLSFRLISSPDAVTRSRTKSEINSISAKDPALWRIYKYDSVTDVVRSVALGIDQIRSFDLRLNSAEFADLLNGSEQLVGINLLPWYIRQVYIR
jgi:hypothetical protein